MSVQLDMLDQFNALPLLQRQQQQLQIVKPSVNGNIHVIVTIGFFLAILAVVNVRNVINQQ